MSGWFDIFRRNLGWLSMPASKVPACRTYVAETCKDKATVVFTKDPDAVLDYKFDWALPLEADGDKLVSSTWIAGDGLTIDSSTQEDTYTTVWLSAGNVGKYVLTNRVTTSWGRTDDRTVYIYVSSQ